MFSRSKSKQPEKLTLAGVLGPIAAIISGLERLAQQNKAAVAANDIKVKALNEESAAMTQEFQTAETLAVNYRNLLPPTK